MGIIYQIFTFFVFSAFMLFPFSIEEEDRYMQEQNIDMAASLYEKCGLEGKLDFEIFQNAIKSLEELEFDNENLVTIIDFSKPSTEKRFFVIDVKNKKLLYHTLVAHGKNTGANEAINFSNTKHSLKTSLGIYSTAEPYCGKHGYSLRLDGLEKGLNDNARERAIVIHGAKYVSTDFIERHGRLGRSWGCPALPIELTSEIIDLIKGGSCVYIYADDENYLENSILAD
jgi:hypothetical protein